MIMTLYLKWQSKNCLELDMRTVFTLWLFPMSHNSGSLSVILLLVFPFGRQLLFITVIELLLVSHLTWTLLIVGLAQLGNLHETLVVNYVRIVMAQNLQVLYNALSAKHRSSWAFSIANDASTHYGKSYFDNRIRFHASGKLHNIHALTIPMFQTHTANNIFYLVSRFL